MSGTPVMVSMSGHASQGIHPFGGTIGTHMVSHLTTGGQNTSSIASVG